MRSLFLCILMLFCPLLCWAESSLTPLILNGFLGKEELKSTYQILDDLKRSQRSTLLIDIQSSSGDLLSVLEVARTIYELKILNQLKVIVYLNDNVVGPAAILPFLADERYCSLSVSWGDIPLNTQDVLPANLLRNRVASLIDNQLPQAVLLHVLADAMSDPSLQVVEDDGWKIKQNNHQSSNSFISAPGQTLVVNQTQLKQLNLINAILTQEQFHAHFNLENQTLSQQNNEDSSLELSKQSIETSFKQAIHFNADGPNSIGYLSIGDHESSISQSTWLYIKQGLDYYKQRQPIFIILELNTPGGEVFAAQKISDALKAMDTQFDIPIVAFINNWAISAGAMLAYSCRFIAVTKDGIMGAAEPVYAGEGGKMETASEKVNSALRSDFASRAHFFNRNSLLAEGMVDKDIILVLRHGKIIKLDQESQIRLIGSEPDIVISSKGKLLTLDADQMLKYKVADLLLPPEKLTEVTSIEKKQGHWPADKELLFKAPFFATIPQATIDAYQMDWKTKFFVFLATPFVSSLLFMGLMIGAYMELNNPGLSLPGGIAATCLFLIILSSFSLEIANWLELILLLTGLALLLIEFFVLPTFGLLGLIGIILFLAGLFGMMLPELNSVHFEPNTQILNAAGQYLIERLAWLCGALILSAVTIALLARYITPNLIGFKRFVLTGHEQDASKGYVAGEDLASLPQPGTQGEVIAPLRPTGKISVQNRVYDAISREGFIEAGEKIVINSLEENLIIVNRLKGAE